MARRRPSATIRPSAAASAKATTDTQSVTSTPWRSARKMMRVVAVGDDQPGEEEGEEDRGEQPVGNLAAGRGGRLRAHPIARSRRPGRARRARRLVAHLPAW